ncbi:hypothetical protein QOT17_000116 [Balamuthia mandrillaris]
MKKFIEWTVLRNDNFWHSHNSFIYLVDIHFGKCHLMLCICQTFIRRLEAGANFYFKIVRYTTITYSMARAAVLVCLLFCIKLITAQVCLKDTGLTPDQSKDPFRCSPSIMIPCDWGNDTATSSHCVNHRAGCLATLPTDLDDNLKRALCPGAHPVANSISVEWAAKQGISANHHLWYSHDRDLSKRLLWRYADTEGSKIPTPLKPKYLVYAHELILDCKQWTLHYGLNISAWCYEDIHQANFQPQLTVYSNLEGNTKTFLQYRWREPPAGKWHPDIALACNPNTGEAHCIWYDGTNIGHPGSVVPPASAYHFVRYDNTELLSSRMWGGYACNLSDLVVKKEDNWTCSWEFTNVTQSSCRNPITNLVDNSKCTRTADCRLTWENCISTDFAHSAYDDFEDRQVKVIETPGEGGGVYHLDLKEKSLWYPYETQETICFFLECIQPASWSWLGNSWQSGNCNETCCMLLSKPAQIPADFCCKFLVMNGIHRRPFCPAPVHEVYSLQYILENHADDLTYVYTAYTTGMTTVCGTKAYRLNLDAPPTLLEAIQNSCRGNLTLTVNSTGGWGGTAHQTAVYTQARFGASFTEDKSNFISFLESDHFADMFRIGGNYVDENDPTTLRDFFDKEEAHQLLDYGIANNQSFRSDILNRAYPSDKTYITDLDYAPHKCSVADAPNVYLDEQGKPRIWIPAGSKYVTYSKDGNGEYIKGAVSTMGSTTGAEDLLPTSSDQSMSLFRVPCLPIADFPGGISWLGCDGTAVNIPVALPSEFNSSFWPYTQSSGLLSSSSLSSSPSSSSASSFVIIIECPYEVLWIQSTIRKEKQAAHTK